MKHLYLGAVLLLATGANVHAAGEVLKMLMSGDDFKKLELEARQDWQEIKKRVCKKMGSEFTQKFEAQYSEMSADGFKALAIEFDDKNSPTNQWVETIPSKLLAKIGGETYVISSTWVTDIILEHKRQILANAALVQESAYSWNTGIVSTRTKE